MWHPSRLLLAFATLALAQCGGSEEVDRFVRVPSESMEPTYSVGDVVRVDSKPESVALGDIVIFHPPKGADLNTCGVAHRDDQPCPEPTRARSRLEFVKRIVAEGGDRVSIRDDGIVYIDGRRRPEDYARTADLCPVCNLPREATIPQGHVFVMGDNRGESADSRMWGPVPEGWITGKVLGLAKGAQD